jgi:hypothetical protein
MPTSTFYPDPSTSVDGFVYRDVASENWSTIRSGAGTGADDSSTTCSVQVYSSSTTDEWSRISRVILLFDTSSLPDDANITAASLGLYVTAVTDPFSDSLIVTSSGPASSTALVNADYGTFAGDIEYSSPVSNASLSLNTYNIIPLNATGRAAIALTGLTQIGLRSEFDRSAVAPSWQSSTQAAVDISTSEESGTSQDPYLEVTYNPLGQPHFQVVRRFFKIHR